MPRFASLLLLVALATPASAQVIPFDSSAWEIQAVAHQLVDYRGQHALWIKGGSAELSAPVLTNGEIEFDIAFSAERNFAGVQWRVVDDANGEIFYFRPHLSGMPDANQYTPVDNGVTGWQMYHGPQYSVPTRYRHNEWQHVKIAFKDRVADIYVDSDQPVLTVEMKREPAAGKLAVYSSNLAPAFFANFEFRTSDDIEIVGAPVALDEAPAGTVTRWSVSDAFAETLLDDESELSQDLTDGFEWSSLDSEANGVANLATVARLSDSTNTVLARVNLKVDGARTERVRFGYSDRVRVFLNGRLLYSGNNGYMSRDYRYLGTIGLFDALALPLEEGDNELVFAVSESFGGWAIWAQLDDPDSISWASTNP